MPITLNIVDKNSTIWCLHPDCLLDTVPFNTREELCRHTALCHNNDPNVKQEFINIGNELAENSIHTAIERVKSTYTEKNIKNIEISPPVQHSNPRKFYWLSQSDKQQTSVINDWAVLEKRQKDLLNRLDSLCQKVNA